MYETSISNWWYEHFYQSDVSWRLCRSIGRTSGFFRAPPLMPRNYSVDLFDEISIWPPHRSFEPFVETCDGNILGPSVYVSLCLSLSLTLSLTESNDKPWRIHCATREQAFMLSRLDRSARETRTKSVYFASKNSSRERFRSSRTMIVSTKPDYCIRSMQSICIRCNKWRRSINSRQYICIFIFAYPCVFLISKNYT